MKATKNKAKFIRVTFYMNIEFKEKLREISYHKRISQKVVLNQILEKHFEALKEPAKKALPTTLFDGLL